MTQRESILEYLKQNKTITPMEAFRELGITKLATRISEMRRDGIRITKKDVTTKNRHGHRVTFKEYSLEES